MDILAYRIALQFQPSKYSTSLENMHQNDNNIRNLLQRCKQGIAKHLLWTKANADLITSSFSSDSFKSIESMRNELGSPTIMNKSMSSKSIGAATSISRSSSEQ